MEVYMELGRMMMRVAVATALGLLFLSGESSATKYKAPATEVALLPRFCWGQYLERVDGPGYEIQGCGPLTNHYCDGLLELARANKTFGNKSARIQHLKRAKENTLYTLNGIAQFPSCAIRNHVETTLQRLNVELAPYGVR
jgi:hypothetical protein